MADFEDFTKPRAGKPAAAGASFDDFVPEKPAETPKPSYPKRALGAAASLADLIVSLPGFVMGTAADAGSRLVGTLAQPWSGESRRDVAQGGLRAFERTMHLFGNPFQKLIAGLEGGAEAYEGSTPAVLMQKPRSHTDRLGRSDDLSSLWRCRPVCRIRPWRRHCLM